MTQPTIAFSYPRRGLTGEFNTFRLGARAAEKYPPGTVVELVDSRTKRPLKRATVTCVFVGVLTEMASLHAHQAHNWKEHPAEDQANLLIFSMMKRYPPNRVHHTSVVSVIYLKELPDESL